jgi:hypothetical protein
MAAIPRLLFAAGVAAIVALGGAARANACGSNGYTYSGLGAQGLAYGISAEVTPVAEYAISRGHVAGWIGVGGPGEGPGGTNEWLQVGLSGFPGVVGDDVYYEVTLPHRFPTYHQVAANLPAGKTAALAVLELRGRPNWWQVWLDGAAVSPPVRLPASHHRWRPTATAESWDGGQGGACNNFLFDFHRVRVAHAPGGSWRLLSGGAYTITSSATRIRRSRSDAAFLAAEGLLALQLLPKLKP